MSSVGPDQEPWANIRSVSTTSGRKQPKIRRPRRARQASRRQALPHKLAARYGVRAPVTLTLTIRSGADLWLEVLTEQGRFFCSFDVSAFALVEQIIHGGHWVEELSAGQALTHRRGAADLS